MNNAQQNEEIEALKQELAIYRKMNETAMIGWWHVNYTTQIYSGSELLRNTIDLSENKITFEELHKRIHPDHAERVIRNTMLFRKVGFYEDEFSIMTKYGYRWVHSKLGEKRISANGDIEAFGYLRFLDEKEVKMILGHNAETEIKNVIDNYISISSSLFNSQSSTTPQHVIIQILNNLLEQFNADRVYIFEFDEEKQNQSCIFEVTAYGVKETKNKLQNISAIETRWWFDKLLNNIPIAVNNIDDLPPNEENIKKSLLSNEIKSILTMPLLSRDGVWGYIGIEVVKEARIWSNLDKQWLFALGTIIGLCAELKKSEQIAQNQQTYYRNLYENMPIGFLRIKIITDANGYPVDYMHLEINKVFESITGTAREDIIGKYASELITITKEMLNDLYNTMTHDIIQNNFQLFTPNGSKYYHYSAYNCDNKETIITFYDTTETIKANMALSKSEERLRKIYNSMLTGVEIYNKEGILTDINNTNLDIFGITSKDSILGQVNLFKNPILSEELLNDLKTGNDIETAFKYDFSKIAKENYYKTTLKNVKNLSVRGTVLFDEDNDIEGYLLNVIDNTDTIKAFDKIQEFEILFDSIAEFSKIGLSHWQPLNNHFNATDQWYNNLEYSDGKVQRITDAYINMNAEDAASIKQQFDDLTSGKISFFHKEVLINGCSGPKWLRCSYKTSKFDPENNILEIIGFNIDITELKETEFELREAKTKAEESDKLKSAFVANMSHEIRTPLNAIVGFSDLLIQTEDIKEREQYSLIIRRNNDLLLQLISDILDISRIESGITCIHIEPININDMLEEVLYTNVIKITNDVELIIDTHSDNDFIQSDRNGLIQIFNNLVGNAIKFTAQGSIHVGYKTEDDKIQFYVCDTGMGIAEQNIESIFNRFVKLNTFMQGTGLGLSICKSIIEKLNGQIWVESKKDKGSCFWIELPYNQQDNVVAEITIETEPSHCEEVKKHFNNSIKPLILVAEDTDSNYLLISAILKNDYRLVRANNGLEAVQLFQTLHPDLILMDMRMPDMDGLEATMKIRETDKTTPIIAVTAFAFDQDKTKALHAGCNSYLPKPLNYKTLKELILKYIQ